MKSQHITLLNLIITQCGGELSVDTTRDLEEVARREEDQGMSFLTITLPAFHNDFVRSLDEGQITPNGFRSFRKSSSLPAFLQGFSALVFDRTTGALLTNPSIPAIQAIRQITLMYGKVKLECTPTRVKRAVEGFLECERELGFVEERLDPRVMDDFLRIGRALFADVFSKMDNDIANYRLMPKHGPGSTADRLLANAKYRLPRWTDRLEDVFPYWRYGTSRPYASKRYEQTEFSEPGTELPVKVIMVPKTLKTPRVIAIEPTHMQYVQQALLASFTEHSREDMILGRMISTEFQLPNQELARLGSSDGSLATLDLSEASDRVSNFLVQGLMASHPHLNEGVQACRSTHAKVPSEPAVVIPLRKFASMGSALCFPMEMAVFLTVVFLGIERAKGIRFRGSADFRRFIGSVRVYGDDIIVPVDTTSSVIEHLHLFGFKVNERKSFWTGKFRESCGAEFYDGHDVTVTRVRRMFPAHRRHVDELVSTVDLRNQLYKRGFWPAVRFLDDLIEKIIPFPAVLETSSVLGKTSFLGYQEERQCPDLQRPQVRGAVVRYTPRRSIADGDAALMKFFLKPEVPFEVPLVQDKNHLVYAGRPVASRINYRWAYSY